MYTSSDLGSGNTADNPYPMNQTRLYTLASGLDPGVQGNWVSRGVVFTESQINGVGVLGNCGGTGRPYLEGLSLHGFPFATGLTGVPGLYTLVFAAKPDHVPTECVNYGQPNTTIGLVSAWLHTPVTVYGAVAGDLRADAPPTFPIVTFDILHV